MTSHYTHRNRILGKAATTALLFGLTLASCVQAHAQSLTAQQPAPLQAGPNDGTVDNFVGPNYFYLWAGPGKTIVTISYRSMSLLGNAMRSNLTVELTDANKTWVQRTTISSLKESSQRQLVGTLKKETKLLIAVLPPSGGLVRSGGDYEITVTGPARFGKALSDTELITGTYTPMVTYDNENTATKFLPDGTLVFASGTTGTWKLFDASSHLYTVTFGNNRLSLRLIPGRGLVAANDATSLVFSAIAELTAKRPPAQRAGGRFGEVSCLLVLQVVERAQAEERGGVAEFFFDTQKLVVLGDAVGAGGCAGLDLAGVRGDGDIGDGGVLGFAGAVADDGGVARALRHFDRRRGFR